MQMSCLCNLCNFSIIGNKERSTDVSYTGNTTLAVLTKWLSHQGLAFLDHSLACLASCSWSYLIWKPLFITTEAGRLRDTSENIIFRAEVSISQGYWSHKRSNKLFQLSSISSSDICSTAGIFNVIFPQIICWIDLSTSFSLSRALLRVPLDLGFVSDIVLALSLNYSDEAVELVFSKEGLLSPELNVMLADPWLFEKRGDIWSNREYNLSCCCNLGN